MSKKPIDSLANLWYAALSTPYGIEVQCSDFDQVRTKLYRLKKEMCDTDLDQIALCQSPFDPSRLWLVKKGTQNETP